MGHPDGGHPLNTRQKMMLVQATFKKTRSDAAELALLAGELRAELNKPDVDFSSMEVIIHAEKIEKLAKKIREESKAY